eukprot:TRINITY_DN6992_c0_g1_i1.p1 TRINITY_DN6992_c0_g1~~TRINITY_DN6992_c0_g1_i1.p1  ORF type:complete len:206 (-),score=41.00 TRINITY_DN6992_c0_g1_i1:70-687(-)
MPLPSDWKERAKPIAKYGCIIFLVACILTIIALGIYVLVVVLSASSPNVEVQGNAYSVDGGFLATTVTIESTVEVQNDNKVALVIGFAELPALWPASSSSNISQTQVGTLTIPSTRIPAGSNGSFIITTTLTNFSTTLFLNLGSELLRLRQTQFITYGTTIGSAKVLFFNYSVPINLNCTYTLSITDRTATPACDVKTGEHSISV